MAKKNEFKPDKPYASFTSRLYLTPKQRRKLLKWVLYGVLLLALSVLQDVVFARVRILGATTEMVPCGIFLICLAEGVERGAVLSLVAAILYLFSGTAAGFYSIVLIVALSIGVTMFQQGYLQKGFTATMICAGFAIVAYEMLIFAIGLFLSLTTFSRVGHFLLTALLTALAAPALYPVVNATYKIGGEEWTE